MLGSGLFGTVVSVGRDKLCWRFRLVPRSRAEQAISKVVTDDDEDRFDEQDEARRGGTRPLLRSRSSLRVERPMREPTTASADPPPSPTRHRRPATRHRRRATRSLRPPTEPSRLGNTRAWQRRLVTRAAP